MSYLHYYSFKIRLVNTIRLIHSTDNMISDLSIGYKVSLSDNPAPFYSFLNFSVFSPG
jgi:hypothetical protein